MSHQPSKHREQILAFHAAELQERCQFGEGFTPWNADIQHVLDTDLGDIISIQQRCFLEHTTEWRQPLPYILYSRRDVLGVKHYFTYQRTPQGGESRLFKDFSIGPGGHVDGHDVQYTTDTCEFDYAATISANILREAHEELAWFFRTNFADGVGGFIEDLQAVLNTAIPLGWLNDNSNEVGQHHLGIVFEVELPDDVYAEIKEAQNVFQGYKPLEQLREEVASGVSYESWSKLIIDAL